MKRMYLVSRFLRQPRLHEREDYPLDVGAQIGLLTRSRGDQGRQTVVRNVSSEQVLSRGLEVSGKAG